MTNEENDAAPGGTGVGADTRAETEKTGDQQERGPGGRFREGQSGNPAGRRPGSRNRASLVLDALADGEAEAVLQAMVRRAVEGDVKAAEIVLGRAWPVRKGRPVSLDLPPCPRPPARRRRSRRCWRRLPKAGSRPRRPGR